MSPALFQNVEHIVLEDSERVCMESPEWNCIAVLVLILQVVDILKSDTAVNVYNILGTIKVESQDQGTSILELENILEDVSESFLALVMNHF